VSIGSSGAGDCRIRLLKCRNSAGPVLLHAFILLICIVSFTITIFLILCFLMSLTIRSLIPPRNLLMHQLTLLGGFYLFKTAISTMSDNNNSSKTTGSQPVCPPTPAIPLTTPVTPFSVTHVSINNADTAETIARLLLQQKLAACIQILPQMTSLYTWKGQVEKDSEFLMIIKSRTSALEKLTAVVKANHPYEVPEVVTMPVSDSNEHTNERPASVMFYSRSQIIQGNPEYLKWLEEQVPESSQPSG
jgi:periplasmic divalent cation tolerance protein